MSRYANIQRAVERLGRSKRGQNAVRVLLDWLDDRGLGLDAENQECVFVLLRATWGDFTMTARDIMRDALEEWRNEHEEYHDSP